MHSLSAGMSKAHSPPSWQKRLSKLRERCAVDSIHSENFEKRVLYSEVELLRMEIEETAVVGGISAGAADNSLPPLRKDTCDVSAGCGGGHNVASSSKGQLSMAVLREEALRELEQLGESLRLGFVRRRRQWWDKLDEISRLVGVWLCLVIFAVFFSPLGLILRPIDLALVSMRLLHPTFQMSLLLKRFMGHVILCTAGVSLVTEGLSGDINSFFTTNCCILCCFSHASTLDAFIIAAVIPVRSYILSKTDLFLIPFFSWLLAAFGGVPIDRHNRNLAIKSLKIAAESAAAGDCVAVAPEGTRSTTGQLLPFKKGPFHLWEQLQSPITPVVIFGAYDLFPPGSTMTLSGRVYVRFLDPVEPPVELVMHKEGSFGDSSSSSASSSAREKMSRMVRRRMLEALLHAPRDAGSELTWKERAVTATVLIGVFTFARFLAVCLGDFVFVRMKLGGLQVAAYSLIITMTITFSIYVWMVCLQPYRGQTL